MSPETFQAVPLSTEDAAAIYDLHMAYRNSLEVNEEGYLSRHHANLSDLVNIAELSVRRVIAMAKQVPAFRALPQVCLHVCLFDCLCVCLILLEPPAPTRWTVSNEHEYTPVSMSVLLQMTTPLGNCFGRGFSKAEGALEKTNITH